MVAMLKTQLGMGHGDANLLAHVARKPDSVSGAAGLSSGDVLGGLYTGPKAELRPIHDRLLEAIKEFGTFEEAPKRSYVSYRRKKQFAMIGPATRTQVELGLNVKGLVETDRLKELPAGKMCNFKVRFANISEIDREVIEWMRAAYDAAG
jgi:hypothetical protein